MTSRDLVAATIRFQSPHRLPYDLPERYGSDIVWVDMNRNPDYRPPKSGVDEWGAVWKNFGNCNHGEVEDFPLKDWNQLDSLKIPDVEDPKRWTTVDGVRHQFPDKFLLAIGISIYERVHFTRGLENAWIDIYTNPEDLCRLIDILVEMNIKAIKRYAAAGIDGYMFADDWGLQNRLMISPDTWREIWKPRYARIYKAAHEANLFTFLHSCGYIIDILDDLIEIGLDVVHMDQQENMGLELLGERFGGRITFFAPVDTQRTMATGTPQQVRVYARRMAELLGRPEGGFIPRWYTDPAGAGHKPECLDAMCDEFLKISEEFAERHKRSGNPT